MSYIIAVLAIWIAASVVLGFLTGRFIDRGHGVILLAILLGSASSASAQPAPNWSAYTVMAAGNVADLWTTKIALDSGRAHEGNPALERQGIGTITVAKTVGVLAITAVMRLLETHGHQKAAKILGYADGAVTFGVSAHNLKVVR